VPIWLVNNEWRRNSSQRDCWLGIVTTPTTAVLYYRIVIIALSLINFVLVFFFFSPHVVFQGRFKEIEEKTGYSKVYFFVLSFFTLVSLLLTVGGVKLLSDLVAFLYPAYASFKAIDSGKPEDDAQWLTYWVVFSFFSVIENSLWFIVGWIPMYFVLKISFFLWLYHPSFLGAGLVYQQVLRPIVLPYVKGPAVTTTTKKVT
jgi:receptor expression-enhancing protein 5/6